MAESVVVGAGAGAAGGPPFIVVSGTIGEATAVEVLKAGAHDFIVKGKLARLLPAVERELREVKVRDVRTQNRKGKQRRFRFHMGRLPHWKKAVVVRMPVTFPPEAFED